MNGIMKICAKKTRINPIFAVDVPRKAEIVINITGRARNPLTMVFRVVVKKPSPMGILYYYCVGVTVA